MNVTTRPRLRLDPDLIGHPGGLKALVESEYWHGPRYSDDIASIPSGVTVHKASDRTRQFEGVDKTQFWWKSPDTRGTSESAKDFRTLEIEELMDFPAAGLPEGRYGCRYVHGEYSMDDKSITHFDGAIRAYPAESYLRRIDLSIDHAGKHSEYTKLFRFDGELAIDIWKRLLSDYFRGNPLVPEYLGAPQEELTDEGGDERSDRPPAAVAHADVSSDIVLDSENPLCAFIHLRPGRLSKKFDLALRRVLLPDGKHTVSVMETGIGVVDEMLRARLSLTSVASMRVPDNRLELVPLLFGSSECFPGSMYQQVQDLAAALATDVSKLGIKSIALSITWPLGDVLSTLSIRGPSQPLLSLLARLFSIVDATKPASDWIEPLSESVKGLSLSSMRSGRLDGVLDGILSFGRNDAMGEVMFPPELAKELIEKGFLMAETP